MMFFQLPHRVSRSSICASAGLPSRIGSAALHLYHPWHPPAPTEEKDPRLLASPRSTDTHPPRQRFYRHLDTVANRHARSLVKTVMAEDLYGTKIELPPDFSAALRVSSKTGPISTLHIFDFDSTLIRTPHPIEGKEAYLRATGTKWKGGWWGRRESLSPPVLPSPVPASRIIRTTFTEMAEIVQLSQTAVAVVVTGRIAPLRPSVIRILHEAAVSIGRESSNDAKSFVDPSMVFTHPGGRLTTIEFKKRLIYSIVTSPPLHEHPLAEVHIWEDRREHADIFATEFADVLMDKTKITVIVHFVPPEMP